jgi:plasmid maintenance system antidote protein VapI
MQTAFDRLIATPEGREAYCYEATATGVRELIWKLLDERGMSQGELAQQMGVTAGRVSQLLDGRANLTLATIAKTLSVFGCVLKVDVDPLIPVQRSEEEWNRIVPTIGNHRIERFTHSVMDSAPAANSNNYALAG